MTTKKKLLLILALIGGMTAGTAIYVKKKMSQKIVVDTDDWTDCPGDDEGLVEGNEAA